MSVGSVAEMDRRMHWARADTAPRQSEPFESSGAEMGGR